MFKFVVLVSFVAGALGGTIPAGLQPVPELDGRIVGGWGVSIASYPYQISLQRSGSHSCGGSIYSTTVIVTAAHCLQSVAASSLRVRIGSTYWSSGGTLLEVASFKNNPNYSSSTHAYDVAVLRTKSAMSYGTNVRNIGLASSAPGTGTSAIVTGWGTLSSGGSIPSNLQAVDVKMISQSACASGSYSYGSQIKATMICAAASGKDACQGDSGGPLVANGVLVGVVSWGYGCADPRYPGVYADVAALRSWITSA